MYAISKYSLTCDIEDKIPEKTVIYKASNTSECLPEAAA